MVFEAHRRGKSKVAPRMPCKAEIALPQVTCSASIAPGKSAYGGYIALLKMTCKASISAK